MILKGKPLAFLDMWLEICVFFCFFFLSHMGFPWYFIILLSTEAHEAFQEGECECDSSLYVLS